MKICQQSDHILPVVFLFHLSFLNKPSFFFFYFISPMCLKVESCDLNLSRKCAGFPKLPVLWIYFKIQNIVSSVFSHITMDYDNNLKSWPFSLYTTSLQEVGNHGSRQLPLYSCSDNQSFELVKQVTVFHVSLTFSRSCEC